MYEAVSCTPYSVYAPGAGDVVDHIGVVPECKPIRLTIVSHDISRIFGGSADEFGYYPLANGKFAQQRSDITNFFRIMKKYNNAKKSGKNYGVRKLRRMERKYDAMRTKKFVAEYNANN